MCGLCAALNAVDFLVRLIVLLSGFFLQFLPERSSRDIATSKKHRGNLTQVNGATSFQKHNGYANHMLNGVDEDHDRGRPRERSSPTTRRKRKYLFNGCPLRALVRIVFKSKIRSMRCQKMWAELELISNWSSKVTKGTCEWRPSVSALSCHTYPWNKSHVRSIWTAIYHIV